MIQYQLDAEKEVIKDLERQYQAALNQINEKIRILQSDELTQSRIYQLNYQKALKGQVQGILEKLHGDEYSTLQKYLHDCYTDAFVGTMYNLHGQGMPFIIPIDQNAAVKAILTDSKIKDSLYETLGVDVAKLKKAISSEITRGIASNLTYQEIARNISNVSRAPLSRAKTIANTEGHRIQQASTYDAQNEAKARGAAVVKQWDASLDGATRDTHRKLDGQIREIDEPFEADGKKAMFPGDFGRAEEDCNCRCVSLTRARAALDADELRILQERAAYHGLLVNDSEEFGKAKAKDFADFKKKYLKATKTAENAGKTLKKQGKSGTIELPKDPYYDGLSKGDIAQRYIKEDGSNLLDKTFFDLPLETEQEAVRGYDKAITLFGAIPPQRIKVGKLGGKVYARYDLDFKTITLNPKLVVEKGEAYATIIHEMTHHAENVKQFASKSVVNAAFKKLGLSSTSKKADTLRMKTVGLDADWEDPREVVACAVEREMVGKRNPLTEAIYSILREKGVIK